MNNFSDPVSNICKAFRICVWLFEYLYGFSSFFLYLGKVCCTIFVGIFIIYSFICILGLFVAQYLQGFSSFVLLFVSWDSLLHTTIIESGSQEQHNPLGAKSQRYKFNWSLNEIYSGEKLSSFLEMKLFFFCGL